MARILIQWTRQSMAEEKALGVGKTEGRGSGKMIILGDLHNHGMVCEAQ